MQTESNKVIFVQLIQQNKGIIYKVCHSYCAQKSDIDDLSQEIVYQLWKSFDRYDAGFKFSTWMYRIALNVAISYYRKGAKTKPSLPYSEQLIVMDEPNETGHSEDNLAMLLQFIDKLKDVDKTIMLLYLEEKSYKEIAAIMGISESNVSTRVSRIKQKMKSIVQTIKK